MTTTIKVKGCGGCPFAEQKKGSFYCTVERMSTYNYVMDKGRPDWCPLKTGDVTVKMDKK